MHLDGLRDDLQPAGELDAGVGVGAGGRERGRGLGHRPVEGLTVRAVEAREPGAGAGAQRLDLGLQRPQLGLGGAEPVLGPDDVVGQHRVGHRCGRGVFESAADRARVAVGQCAGQLCGHAVEPALPQVEQLAATVEGGGAQVGVVRRQPLGTGEVVLGRVEHRDPGPSGVEQQLELGHPTGAGGSRRDLGSELLDLGLGLGELGPDALGQGRELRGALVELGVLAGPQRLVVGLPGERGGGAVERQQTGEHRGHLAVGQRGERAGGEGVAGAPDLATAGGHVVGRPGQGGEVAGQAGSPLGGGEGGHPLDVARPGGLEPLQPCDGTRAAGAQVVEGACGGQRLRRRPLGPGCRVEGGHRRAHPGVEPVGDGAQVGADATRGAPRTGS